MTRLINKIRFKESRGLEALFLYSLAYYVITLAWQWVFLPTTLGIMLAAFFWLLQGGFRAKLTRISGNFWAGLFLLYYLLLVIGSWNSPLESEATKELFAKLPLLAWPILLGTSPALGQSSIRWLIQAFVISVALAMIYSFGESAYRYWQQADPSLFYFSELLAVGRVPPHYMGMYVSFAYALHLYFWLDGRPLWSSKVWNIFLVFIFLISIAFIWVRMQYFIFMLVNLALFGRVAWLRSRAKALGLVLLMLGLFFGMLWSFSGTRSRLVDTYNEWRSREGMIADKQTNPRVFLWSSTWDLIQEHWWWGVGTGAENAELNQALEKVDAPFWDGQGHFQLYEMRYNVHNSFLQHWLANGFFQFVVFSSFFIAPIFAFRKHPFRWPAALFLGISALSFFTESMLQRQAGLLFFSFFYALFFIALLRPDQALGAKKGEKQVEQKHPPSAL